MNQLTAAHRTLPFGTRLLVTNRDTSQSAEVRVNDRGPFVKGRILDVSYAAARQLGAVGAGIFPVRLRVIALPGTRADGPAATAAFTVQVGAFTSRARAEALRDAVGGDAIDHRIHRRGRDRLPRPRRLLLRPHPGHPHRPHPHRPRLPTPSSSPANPADTEPRGATRERARAPQGDAEHEGRGAAGARGTPSPGPWLLRASEAAARPISWPARDGANR